MFIYTTRDDGAGFDVSSLAYDVTYTSSIDGQPGKLTFSLKKDPNGILKLENGYAVAFWHDGHGVFFGYIFTMGLNSKGEYKITAYDQMRYLQNHSYEIVANGDTLDGVFDKVCTHLNLKHKIVSGCTQIKLRPKVYVDEKAYDIIKQSMDEVAVGGYTTKGGRDVAAVENTLGYKDMTSQQQDAVGFWNEYFIAPFNFIRDRFGILELNEIQANAKASRLVVIGEGSLLTDYDYQATIDSDTYNRIEFLENIEKQGKRYVGDVEDKETQKKWGVLKLIKEVHGSSNTQMFDKYKQLLLESTNRVQQSIKINALGVDGLYAGDSFVFDLKSKLGIYSVMYITGITHNYGRVHTMSIDTKVYPNLAGAL